MNNIEILEEFIENYNEAYPEEKEWVAIYPEQIKAIENLIQENKELKEHLQKYYNGELYTAKQLKNIEENQRKYFIHKSKVKELRDIDNIDLLQFKIKELLEEGE